MKFKRYLEAHQEDIWKANYIRYGELKKLLDQILEAGAPVYVPTALSLTVGKKPEDVHRTPQEEFFRLLEADVQRISEFTTRIASDLRSQLREVLVGLTGGQQHPQQQQSYGELAAGAANQGSGPDAGGGGSGRPPVLLSDLSDPVTREHRLAAARRLGEGYLRLEKYVNLNYTGLQKILKKHDKLIPSAPCWKFYKVHINGQPWVRGDHHDIQVSLSRIFSQLHSAAVAAGGGGGRGGDSGPSAPGAALVGSSHHKDYNNNTYWVRLEDMALVKHVLMQHMAVQPPPGNSAAVTADVNSGGGGAAAMWAECDTASHDMVNCIFLDNASLELYHNLLYGRPYSTTLQLRWYGSRVPETIDVIRQVHREGWRPEDCTEDSFPIQETRVADFLNGRWTWADARKLMMPNEYDNRHKHTHRHKDNIQTDNQHDHNEQQPAMGEGRAPGGGTDRASSNGNGSGVGQTHGSAADDPAQLAKEYQLFKTFTEVARLVESKGLQPIVQVHFRSTTFREPCNDRGLRAVLEEDVQMLLEYAYDTTTRLSYGLWRQEHPADAIEFPYSVFKIQRLDVDGEVPLWLRNLLQSGLLKPINDFSKFLHACAGLLPDMVRAVPQWIDDEAVQKSLYANVMANDELQALLLAGHNVVAELEEGVLEQTAAAVTSPIRTASLPASQPRKGGPKPAVGAAGPTAAPQGHPRPNQERTRLSSFLMLFLPWKKHKNRDMKARTGAVGGGSGSSRGDGGGVAAAAGESAVDSPVAGADGEEGEAVVKESSPIIPLLHSLQRTVSSRLGGAAAAVQAGWQAKLLQRQALQGRAYLPQLIFLDPSQFLRNERIFLLWMRTAITVGGIATGMLGFAASAHTDPYERPTIHISETTAFILLAMAIAMAGYGLGAFVWRSTRFYEMHPGRFDDTTGALSMTVVVTFALFSLLICNMADLVEVLGDDEGQGLGRRRPGRPGALGTAEARAGLLGQQQGVGMLGRGGGAAWGRA
ncbi:hypothetical protein VaNZ11_002977 [Volvox africanus]|uniref:SPX domain-containing protein n=1 Tax=Volvox africanus TaxID=51714 RepID=A0ABQ5RU31_9CHLO|nr:hypothetical protein VaNZ11_002977 [Volvox africanus]